MPLDQNATATDLQTVDLLVGGGAQDRQQEIVMRDLRGAKALALREKIDSGTRRLYLRSTSAVRSLLRACCWAISLGLFDFVSVHPGPNAHRCIGNLVIQVTAKRLAQELEAMTGSPPYLIGFENHGVVPNSVRWSH